MQGAADAGAPPAAVPLPVVFTRTDLHMSGGLLAGRAAVVASGISGVGRGG